MHKSQSFFPRVIKVQTCRRRRKTVQQHWRPIGKTVEDKLAFIGRYKFTIAFENESHPGYTTEKIYEPMLVNSLPVYWGNPLVHRDFNPASFLNYYDYGSQDALIARIIEVDQNDDLYCDYLRQPWFHGNQINRFINPENVLAQFDRIFSSGRTPIAQRRSPVRYFRVDRACAPHGQFRQAQAHSHVAQRRATIWKRGGSKSNAACAPEYAANASKPRWSKPRLPNSPILTIFSIQPILQVDNSPGV